jgi:hypothetical protein
MTITYQRHITSESVLNVRTLNFLSRASRVLFAIGNLVHLVFRVSARFGMLLLLMRY